MRKDPALSPSCQARIRNNHLPVTRTTFLTLAILCLVAVLSGRIVQGAFASVPFSFSTNTADGRMGMLSRPDTQPLETEAADDFLLTSSTTITSASFNGLVLSASIPTRVVVEIYRVFPKDSTVPPSGHVPT